MEFESEGKKLLLGLCLAIITLGSMILGGLLSAIGEWLVVNWLFDVGQLFLLLSLFLGVIFTIIVIIVFVVEGIRIIREE